MLTLRAVKDSNWVGGPWGLVPVCQALSVRANGSIGPLNLQSTINSGGGEGGWTQGVLLYIHVLKSICSEG